MIYDYVFKQLSTYITDRVKRKKEKNGKINSKICDYCDMGNGESNIRDQIKEQYSEGYYEQYYQCCRLLHI